MSAYIVGGNEKMCEVLDTMEDKIYEFGPLGGTNMVSDVKVNRPGVVIVKNYLYVFAIYDRFMREDF